CLSVQIEQATCRIQNARPGVKRPARNAACFWDGSDKFSTEGTFMKKLHTALTFALGAAVVRMTAHAQTAHNQTTQPPAAGTQPPASATQPPGTAVNPTPPGDTRPRMGQGDNETAFSDDDRQFLEDAIQ